MISLERLHINFANVHCEECESTILEVVSQFYNVRQILSPPTDNDLLGEKAIVYIRGNDFDLYSSSTLHIKKVNDKLQAKGLQILSWELFKNGKLFLESKTKSDGPFQFYQKYKSSKSHLKNCKICKNEMTEVSEVTEEIGPKPAKAQAYKAAFTIEGMESDSVDTVSEVLDKIVPNQNYEVSQNSATVIIENKQLINQIIHTLDGIGFECLLVDVVPIQMSMNIQVNAVIGGISCAACGVAIQAAIRDLPFLLESGVNIVSKTGKFILEESTDGLSKNLDALRTAIEDAGFDLEVVKTERINHAAAVTQPRSIHINVDGIFCGQCPEIINNYLSTYGDTIIIEDPITLDNPFIKFTYIPSASLTIRKFMFDLNHLVANDVGGYRLSDSNGTFNCDIVEPITMEERLNILSKKEVTSVARRLIIAFIFAIPTFIFGVVSMSLLSKSNKFRIWMGRPIWAGNVSRETWVLLFLSTPVYFFAADIFHKKALKEIKSLWAFKNSYKKRFFQFGSMNMLMSLGTTISYVASIALLILSAQELPNSGGTTTYFDTVVFLTFFLLIGRLLEAYSKKRTGEAIADLGALKSNVATLVEKVGDEFSNDQEVDVKLLEIGDYIRIVSGESPPVDCVIVKGESEFDESALTGESTPVKHSVGHQIFSGTVNTGNVAIISKILSLEGDSLIDQIVNTVRDGQLRKAPIERTADLLTSYFVPVITLFAILTWVIWLSLGLSGVLPDSYMDIKIGGWYVWSLEFSIAVFCIACPCGIGLAAPTALFVGSGLAAKNGILAKGGGVAFQDGARTNVVCFDKTGTLTNGEVQVTDYYFNINDISSKDITVNFALQVARDLELGSNHPLAKAVKIFIESIVQKHGVKLSQNKIPLVENIPGQGMAGKIISGTSELWNEYNPSYAMLGNETLCDASITQEQKSLLNQWKTECKSVILVAMKCEKLFGNDEYNLVLMMAARDQIRAESKRVINFLQSQHIECWMITGDNRITAEAIAKEIGIVNVVSEVLPSEKQEEIKRLQLKGGVVAMIGDGINDAPALATADVGIALSSGADLAVTLSDFILLNKSHPLLTLVTLFDLSRVVFRRIRFNFGWALVYNMIGIPIAAGVIYPIRNSRLNPVWASAAMAASSISVVMSSLALKLYKPKLNVEEDESVFEFVEAIQHE